MTYHQVCNKSDMINVTMSHVREDLLTVPEHLKFILVFSAIRVTRSLAFCVILCRSLFVLFLLAIVLSLLRITASDYFFRTFKLFFIDKRVDIFIVYTIHLITLSKTSTQILTNATSNIVGL